MFITVTMIQSKLWTIIIGLILIRVIVLNDFSSYPANQWNQNMSDRMSCQNSILLRIIKWNSKVCYGADEFVSKAAEDRYEQRNHNEVDYVCKQHDFCFRNLAPIRYGY